MSKDKLIPEIRFPEFKEGKEWVVKKLGLLTNTTIGEFVIKTKQDPNSPYPVYNGGKSYTGFYDEYNNEANKIVISARGANAGFVNLVKQKYWAGNSCYSIEVIEQNKIDLELLFYYIKHNQKRFTDNQQAANIPSVSKGDVEKFQICYPDDILEQQKIASCLSSLDEVITAHSQKLELLKDHKKGLMQNLFPQMSELGLNRLKDDRMDKGNKKILKSSHPSNPNSDNVPKLRFKEFEKDGEWVEKTFEQLFEIGNGRDYKHLDKGEIPVYGSGGYMLAVDDYLYDGESVCIGRKGTIDKPMFLTGKFWTVDTLFYTHSFKNCLPKYIFYVFENINWRDHNEAGGVPSLSKTNIYKIELLLPPTIQEQQKIASCLSSLDALITAQAEKIEQLKWHKKGLMQGLFPKMSKL